jgi:hypothetical protein
VRDPIIGPKTRQLLVERYREVASELTEVLGAAPPWRSPADEGEAAV